MSEVRSGQVRGGMRLAVLSSTRIAAQVTQGCAGDAGLRRRTQGHAEKR